MNAGFTATAAGNGSMRYATPTPISFTPPIYPANPRHQSKTMNQINRITSGTTIDRTRVIRFCYDDKKYQGYPGDTLASALLANGVTVIGRSFKYHRPRGIFSAGAEEPNALVQLEKGPYTEPNRRATEVELYDGLIAYSQNCWPSVGFDLRAINSYFARILPAGFYYKTFMWPQSLWMTYEKFIRKAAGLGHSPTQSDPDFYDKTHAHCDVLVVGGGPAGLQAACTAGASGARVILADEKAEMGGYLLGDKVEIDGVSSEQWISTCLAKLKKMEQVTILPRTTVTGYYDYNFLVANERVSEHLGSNQRNGKLPKERLWKIRAKQVILATGSIERPLVFADNDRPGVMLAGAVRVYINRFGVLPGKRIVVLTNNDSAYHTAIDAKNAGATVEVVDIRERPHGELIDAAKALSIRIHANTTISAVVYARGKIKQVQIMMLSPSGNEVHGNKKKIACDVVAVSGGWTPTVHLFSQAKGKLQFCDTLHSFIPENDAVSKPTSANQLRCVGACRGIFSLSECLEDGYTAGIASAMVDSSHKAAAAEKITLVEPQYGALRPLWILPCDHPIGVGPKKHFHELQNDSTIADLALATREGFQSVEHSKRYTTTGMATDQGKTSNMNALAALANLQSTPIPTLGVTTFRPPYTPLTFGAIVGHERRDLFLQKRTTSMHAWHDQHGAVYEDVGDWKRPFYFPTSGENKHTAVHRECLAVRNTVGILDASTLGKIDIQGVDSVKLLNMLYTNAWNQLGIERCRYGVMLNEHGMVFDDGVTTRLGEHHYHMTTTTGGAARVLTWIEEWLQTEWIDAKVYCTSVTEQWAVVAVNGPQSRELLAELCDQPIDAESFPFMSMKHCLIGNIPARVFRISFTGELGFEINVPARFGLALWKILMQSGQKYGICPYGTEAMHVLRAEKGFIIVGQDTDGTVTPHDLGMDWLVSKAKTDFVGKRSLSRSDTARSGRKQLVGLLSKDPAVVLPEGAHIVEKLKNKPPMKMLGHVTSSYLSPILGHSIAMALIADGFNRKGECIDVALMNGKSQKATITDSVFYDQHGDRARG